MGSEDDRNAQLVRSLSVLKDLNRTGGVDIYELAERYGTTDRTIRRDLKALQDAGIPLKEEATDGKKKKWTAQYKNHLERLNWLLDAGHYMALRFAMGQGPGLKSASQQISLLEDLADKIGGVLGAKQRKQLLDFENCFYSVEKFESLRAAPDVLWPAVGAITKNLVCDVVYRAPRAEPYDTKFKVLPLRIFAHNGATYLHVCTLGKKKTVIALNLQRLISLAPTDKTAKPPKAYDPEVLDSTAFGVFTGGTETKFRLRFDRDAAPRIRERKWHPTQKLTKTKDGGVVLTFVCADSHEVRSWIAGWRKQVVVLEPAAVREEFADYAKFLKSQYA